MGDINMNSNVRISLESGKPTILGIPVIDIYRNLIFGRMTEEEILRQHPVLVPEDLLAVREYALAEIKSRTHDEFTGRSERHSSILHVGLLAPGLSWLSPSHSSESSP